MRIDISDKFCITSDTNQFIVCTKGAYKSDQKGTDTKEGAKAGDELLTNIGYFSSLRGCFKFLLNHQVRVSDACGFKEILAEIDRIEKELKLAIAI